MNFPQNIWNSFVMIEYRYNIITMDQMRHVGTSVKNTGKFHIGLFANGIGFWNKCVSGTLLKNNLAFCVKLYVWKSITSGPSQFILHLKDTSYVWDKKQQNLQLLGILACNSADEPSSDLFSQRSIVQKSVCGMFYAFIQQN